MGPQIINIITLHFWNNPAYSKEQAKQKYYFKTANKAKHNIKL